jgi:N-acetylmuramoyl-L-alanine amidase CwlA
LPPRHAEATDTRQAIRHHDDPTHQNNRKDQNAGQSSFENTQDEMILSVPALVDFLQNFIGEQLTQNDSVILPDAPPTPSNHGTSTPQTVQAVNAYTHAAHTRTDLSTTHTPTPTLDDTPDTRRAKDLIEKLRVLAARGVPGIAFTPRANILDALDEAIHHMM